MDLYLYNKNNSHIFSTIPFIGRDEEWELLKNATIENYSNYLKVTYFNKLPKYITSGFYTFKELEQYNITKDYFTWIFPNTYYVKSHKVYGDTNMIITITTSNWEYHNIYNPNKR